MSETTLRLSGLSFRVLDRGAGEPVVLLHGFPDSADVWRHQMPALVEAGYRVVAPDLRGFGGSDKPREVEAYAVDKLLGDVTGIMDALGLADAHIVGHDWGANLAWSLALASPERVRDLAVLSVGHPACVLEADIRASEKSWYVLLFQFESAAQRLQADDWRLLKRLSRYHSELERWIPALSRPGALTAALNWYRANANPDLAQPDPGLLPPVRHRVLGVWSNGDAYVSEAQMLASAAYAAGGWRYERVEGASHWLQLDRPARVNELLLAHLAAAPAAATGRPAAP